MCNPHIGRFCMFKFEFNNAIILEQQRALEAELSTSPKAQTVLRKIIRKYVKEARTQVVNGIHFKNGDPRKTAWAVRTAVYKKVLGANINIFNSRKAHGSNSYEPPRKLRQGQRGGNRLLRNRDTERSMHYAPQDRGFILRFVNSGTADRTTRYGSRGAIAARNFFRPLGDRAMGQMRDNLAKAIEAEMQALINENLK